MKCDPLWERACSRMESPRTPPSHIGQTTPVGAAAGCDLLISSPATIPATSYKDPPPSDCAAKSPVSKLTPAECSALGLATWKLKAHRDHFEQGNYSHLELWRLCVGDLRVCRFPFAPVRQPAYNCHPIVWRRLRQSLQRNRGAVSMNRESLSDPTRLHPPQTPTPRPPPPKPTLVQRPRPGPTSTHPSQRPPSPKTRS